MGPALTSLDGTSASKERIVSALIRSPSRLSVMLVLDCSRRACCSSTSFDGAKAAATETAPARTTPLQRREGHRGLLVASGAQDDCSRLARRLVAQTERASARNEVRVSLGSADSHSDSFGPARDPHLQPRLRGAQHSLLPL